MCGLADHRIPEAPIRVSRNFPSEICFGGETYVEQAAQGFKARAINS
jgi:hypothetical protein